ncbi:MAG: SpaA isopeptide-forming pilin-related protein, partial [Fimbriiglobus sp.]|nr:SpaA isopeptide-forming pilin-related protein [Fimbriiglobus sp.]
LPAGTYGVQQVQPAGFLDGKDTPGSTGGGAPQNDTLTAVPLPPGANSINNNFGELVPVIPPPPVPGTVSGFVYEDPNDNGVKEPGEPGIPGVIVRLSNGATTTTDANGFYQFSNLVPGLYTITQSQPAGFIDGKDTAGTTGGTAGNDVISLLTVQPGGSSLNNNFGELKPVSLYGYVWHDVNRNSQFDPSEQGLGGATVTLTGTTLGGRPVTTDLTGAPLVAVTDVNGRYSFSNLPPGNYSVVQTNTPAGFTDFASQNAARLTVTASSNTSFGGVGLNRDAGPLNFGKVQPGVIVDPPTPNPQQPGVVSKQNFLGSTPGATVTVPPSTPGQQLPTAPGNTNPSVVGPTGSGTAGRRIYAVGSGAGTASTVRVLDAATGGELYRFQPFESTFLGGVTTAVGDVTGDGVDDIAVGAGAGGGPRVRVYDGRSGAVIRDFFAYDPTFTGGVFLATGDVDGDGAADLITGAGAGGGPHVRVFSGRTGGELASFFAFDPSYTGGVRVAAGNFLGNGRAQVGTATGRGVAGQVVVYDIAARTPTAVGRFQPLGDFTGGVNLAMGDVDGDGRAELIAGAGAGGGPRVRAINFAGGTVADFFAAAPTFTGGVTVAARDLNADGRADIVVGLGAGGQSRLQVFSGVNLAPLDSLFAFDSNNNNGIFVG